MLLLQVVVLFVGLLAALFFFEPEFFKGWVGQSASPPAAGQSTSTVSSPPEPAVAVIEVMDEGRRWRSLEKLEYVAGPWRTQEGDVLVSVAPRAARKVQSEQDAFFAQPWRITVEWDRGPALVCGLFDKIQYGDPPGSVLPWRLGYCRGRDIDPKGPAVATRVSLLRVQGEAYVRLVIGGEIDVDIYQVQ